MTRSLPSQGIASGLTRRLANMICEGLKPSNGNSFGCYLDVVKRRVPSELRDIVNYNRGLVAFK